MQVSFLILSTALSWLDVLARYLAEIAAVLERLVVLHELRARAEHRQVKHQGLDKLEIQCCRSEAIGVYDVFRHVRSDERVA